MYVKLMASRNKTERYKWLCKQIHEAQTSCTHLYFVTDDTTTFISIVDTYWTMYTDVCPLTLLIKSITPESDALLFTDNALESEYICKMLHEYTDKCCGAFISIDGEYDFTERITP